MHSQVTALPLYSNKAFQESYDLIYNHTDGPWSKPHERYTEDKDGDILKLSDTEWYQTKRNGERSGVSYKLKQDSLVLTRWMNSREYGRRVEILEDGSVDMKYYWGDDVDDARTK